MTQAPLVVLAAALALALAPTAAACEPTSSEPEVDTCDPTGLGIGLIDHQCVYVDNDPCQFDGCLFSVWVYCESNGIPGLQRGDEVRDDTCYGQIEPDMCTSI